MFKIKLENEKGKAIDFSQENAFSVIDIQGLHPSNATININQIGILDGGDFNNAKVEPKSLDIAIAINYEAEANRLRLYKVIAPKKKLIFYYTNGSRDVLIEGYVESAVVDYFAPKQILTVSMLCPYPYFRDILTVIDEVRATIPSFHFPFSIEESNPEPIGYIDPLPKVTITNKGENTVGMIFEMYAFNRVVNPKIFNYETSEFIGVNYDMETGDIIRIDTRKNHKNVKLIRDGEETNIFNNLMVGSKWLNLKQGDTVFTYEVARGFENLSVVIYHSNEYGGV